jgi:hypothetical protein
MFENWSSGSQFLVSDIIYSAVTIKNVMQEFQYFTFSLFNIAFLCSLPHASDASIADHGSVEAITEVSDLPIRIGVSLSDVQIHVSRFSILT